MRLSVYLVATLVGLCTVCAAGKADTANKSVIGWVERVRIFPGDFEVHAKIDTGAKTSSLNAPNLKIFQRDGADWASFVVTNRAGVTQKFEEKILRIAKIRRHGERTQQRPVIMLGVCIGSVYQMTQVNLIDRKNFNYQMLVGRRFLQDHAIVDPGKTFIAKPICNIKASK